MTEAEERFARILLDDFNFYRTQTKHFFEARNPWQTKPLVPSPKRLALLVEMIGWCHERGLEPRLWVCVLFKARAWRFPPKLDAGSIMSENMVSRYRSAKGLGFFKARMLKATPHDGKTENVDVNRDIVHVVEALKARYAETGQHHRCMDEGIIRTLGFHPDSKVCTSCPLASECALRLQAAVSWNVTGLRAGLITIQEAAKQGAK